MLKNDRVNVRDCNEYRIADETIAVCKFRKMEHLVDDLRSFLVKLPISLPDSIDSTILIKPNLNNDLIALTGNSADLRVLGALIRVLRERGYTNIVIADGPNIGIYRKDIDVFGRLGVRALAKHLKVRLVDLNRASSVELQMATGPVRVAKVCLEADCFISVPKIKTHAEAGMSAAVKNLMGCVVGVDKRLMHEDLAANLVAINEQIKPDWILVDGLVGMEGNGPGDGVPKPVNIVISATNAFRLDLLIARLAGLDRENIPYLTIAHHRGYITGKDIDRVDKVEPVAVFEPPPLRGLATRALDHRALTGLRDFTRPIHSSETVRELLYRLGIIQDVYKRADARIEKLTLDRQKCSGCGRCLIACPMQLPVTSSKFDFSASSGCLECLYCVLVCPKQAIIMHGELGYLADHLERYGEAFRCL